MAKASKKQGVEKFMSCCGVGTRHSIVIPSSRRSNRLTTPRLTRLDSSIFPALLCFLLPDFPTAHFSFLSFFGRRLLFDFAFWSLERLEGGASVNL